LLLHRDVATWSVAEPSLGIVAACSATLRPLFKGWGLGWGSVKARKSDNFSGPSLGPSIGNNQAQYLETGSTEEFVGPRSRVADEESLGSDIELKSREKSPSQDMNVSWYSGSTTPSKDSQTRPGKAINVLTSIDVTVQPVESVTQPSLSCDKDGLYGERRNLSRGSMSPKLEK
jgi:hypothetical protein